jgi:hypothetical protein
MFNRNKYSRVIVEDFNSAKVEKALNDHPVLIGDFQNILTTFICQSSHQQHIWTQDIKSIKDIYLSVEKEMKLALKREYILHQIFQKKGSMTDYSYAVKMMSSSGLDASIKAFTGLMTMLEEVISFKEKTQEKKRLRRQRYRRYKRERKNNLENNVAWRDNSSHEWK